MVHKILVLTFLISLAMCADKPGDFVSVHSSGKYLQLQDQRYTFVGTNYWYGVNLGAEIKGNRTGLVKELD